jgi:hypothetical protein
MPTPITKLGSAVWDLPPLILHPFQERVAPSSLLENSKAALILSGLLPSDGADPDDLRRRLVAGRYSEIRMLFYLGKDLFRWIDQCVEWAGRVPELQPAGLCRQSFSDLLVSHTPREVCEKLTKWGVADYGNIFSRAIGLNTMFVEPPEFKGLTEQFLRGYHRYADALYRVYQEAEPHPSLTDENFRFVLYASGEYSKMLESAWEADEPAT